MIPKIIHYCWLSGDPFPDTIKKCMETWKKKLPDYEFILWDTNRFDINSSIWVKQAFEAKKYAFAADYIRLYAVYNYGGIYLDTDVEVIKSYNSLLHLDYFIGCESKDLSLEPATFGASPKCKWVKQCLDYYNDRFFVLENGKYDMEVLPCIMKNVLNPIYHFSLIQSIPDLYSINTNLYVFDKDFFCPKSYSSRIIQKTPNTFSIHQYTTTWKNKRQKIISFFQYYIYKVLIVLGAKKIKIFLNNIFKDTQK